MNIKLKSINLSSTFSFMKGKSRYAFSLIELSIVLIIIGLLVAGITGGKSLIESAKQRALLNEINEWKQSVYAFYAAQGRLPGDTKNKGLIGTSSGYTNSDYPAGTFAAPYNEIPTGYSVAPFTEMYLEGVSDFKPLYTNTSATPGKALPNSKISKSGSMDIFYTFASFNNYTENGNYNDHIATGTFLRLNFSNTFSREKFAIKSLKYIDEKMDDGLFNSGSIRGICNFSGTGYPGYDQALEANNNGDDRARCYAQFYYLGI